MPQSKLVPNLRYGGSGFSAIHSRTGEKISSVTSKDANFYLESDLKERVSITPSGDVWLRVLFTGKDILMSEDSIGEAGLLSDYWERPPQHKSVYVTGPDMAPRFYKDGYGNWWKQTSPCKFTECDDGRGAWCCRNTMKDWPLRHDADRDKEFATCSKLNLLDKTCNLHNEAQGKPLQCVMSPLPQDLMFYVKGGKCTVRWTPVERPDE